jgi:hypothetical protein
MGAEKFCKDQFVWAVGRSAQIVGYRDEGECPTHPGEQRYWIRFTGTGDNWNPWPYCESQLQARD